MRERNQNRDEKWNKPSDELIAQARGLWENEWVKEKYSELVQEQEIEDHNADQRDYFLSEFDRIMSQDFKLTEQDILNVYVPTRGITEARLMIDSVPVHLVDVGGQREERKKWLHCFASVDAVVFVSALSEYDQQLAEDSKVNRLQESVKLFGSVVKVKWFRLEDPTIKTT